MIAQQIQNAADGGFIDVIMLKYTPWLDKNAPLNKALDACHYYDSHGMPGLARES